MLGTNGDIISLTQRQNITFPMHSTPYISFQVQRSTLKRSSKRRASEPVKPPRLPSPNLTHLTAEELSIINSVIHRQERFEQEEADRIK